MAFCEGSVVNEYIRPCNDILFKTKIDEIDTPFKTKSSENHTLSGRTSPLRPYRGVPPGAGMKIYHVIAIAGPTFSRHQISPQSEMAHQKIDISLSM